MLESIKCVKISFFYILDEALNDSLTKCGKPLRGDLTNELTQTLTSLPLTDATGELCVKLDLYVCTDSDVCRMESKLLKEKLHQSDREIIFILDLS